MPTEKRAGTKRGGRRVPAGRRTAAARSAYKPGSRWSLSAYYGDGRERVRAENLGTFDEVVVDGWLHVEQMNRREWWVRLGGETFWVTVQPDGSAVVTSERAPAAPRRSRRTP